VTCRGAGRPKTPKVKSTVRRQTLRQAPRVLAGVQATSSAVSALLPSCLDRRRDVVSFNNHLVIFRAGAWVQAHPQEPRPSDGLAVSGVCDSTISPRQHKNRNCAFWYIHKRARWGVLRWIARSGGTLCNTSAHSLATWLLGTTQRSLLRGRVTKTQAWSVRATLWRWAESRPNLPSPC